MLNDKINKTEQLAEVIFELCYSGIHLKDDYSSKFVRRCISNSIYDMGQKFYSGKISATAKDKIMAGEIKRNSLCHEHPVPRTKTAIEIMTNFSYNKSNTELLFEIKEKLQSGSKINLVLSEENTKLSKYQQDYSLTEEQIYKLAGIHLVDDYITKTVYTYNDIDYYSKKDLSKAMNIGMKKLNTLIKNNDSSITVKEI